MEDRVKGPPRIPILELSDSHPCLSSHSVRSAEDIILPPGPSKGLARGTASRKKSSSSAPEGKLKCPICSALFKNKKSIMRHIKTLHEQVQVDLQKGRPARETVASSSEPDTKRKIILASKDRKGGPINATSGFAEIYEEVNGRSDFGQNALFQELLRLESRQRISIEAERSKGVVHIFAEYLEEASRSVNGDYYKKLLRLMLMYYGMLLKNMMMTLPHENAEDVLVPGLANEFLEKYQKDLDEQDFDLAETVAIISDFCCWMLHKGYTTAKVIIRR